MRRWRRLISVLLAAVMALLLLPAAALAAGGLEVAVTVPHTQTDNSLTNYFAFAAGKWESGNSSHVWSKAVDANDPAATWYEVHFTGHKIDVYSGKNTPMGKVEYFIDGVSQGKYSLYNSSNIDETLIATFGDLTEGPHVLKAVATGEKDSAATNTLIDCAKAVVYSESDLTEPLYGAIVDDDLQYVQEDFSAALAVDAKAATLNAWRNDTAVSQILLAAGQNDLTGVAASAGDFSDGEGHTIAAENVDLSFIKVVQAYTGMPGYATVPARPVPTGSRKDAAEVLMGDEPVDVDAGQVQGLWVSVNVPEDARPGTYSGQVTVTANGLDEAKKLTFAYTLNVASPVLPDATEFKDGFDIELWQNPYASAEYYDVEPFSPEHFAILRPIMEKYKSVGGHAVTATIVDEAWNGQTYSANDVHYPGMVKWTKKADGTWDFNYDQFDAWVDFCKNDIGLGDKLVCYSIAPWSCAISYYDEGSQQNQSITVSTPAGHSDEWDAAWTACLTALKDHLTAKGWTEGVYIGFDERGFSTGAFDIVDGVKGSDGKRFFHIAGAMDGFVNKRDLAMRTDVLSIGSVAVKGHLTEYRSLLAERNAEHNGVYLHRPYSRQLLFERPRRELLDDALLLLRGRHGLSALGLRFLGGRSPAGYHPLQL